jgi:RNA polymerase sigma-70 factor (ECF subfamily)
MDLEQVVDLLTPRLLRYCRARTGDACSGEDVAHDALAALVRRWRRYGPPECAAAFVFAIARRRATRALVRQHLLVPVDTLMGRRDSRRSPEALLVERGELHAMLSALNRLRSRDREALLLAAAADLDTETAAKALGISQSAYKVRTFRARRRLAALLEDRNADSRRGVRQTP